MGGLTEKDFGPEPMAEFERWFQVALETSGQRNPNAMTLCTVSAEGWPLGRIVLLKGHDERGFCFFGNSRSEKGRSLAANPRAELVFHWDALGRQVRVRGAVERLDDAATDAYFATRPRGSQLAAWASQQSEPVASRQTMEERYAKEEARFEVQEVKRPPHWWGYRLKPQRVEFWQEGASRFHDRFVYTLGTGQAWSFTRLNP